LSQISNKGVPVRKAQINHREAERASIRRRFEDAVEPRPHDVTSFFFDLKLLLPQGMTAGDVNRARQAVERRLLRTVRKKDRVTWTADGFFLLIATTDPARAGAAAERIQQDVCTVLGTGDTMETVVREVDPETADPAYTLLPGIDELHASRIGWLT
jgi:hypothetical protein